MEIASKDKMGTHRTLAITGWLAQQTGPSFQSRMAKLGRWMSIRRGQVIYAVGDEAVMQSSGWEKDLWIWACRLIRNGR